MPLLLEKPFKSMDLCGGPWISILNNQSIPSPKLVE
jgi:hypothetical protein